MVLVGDGVFGPGRGRVGADDDNALVGGGEGVVDADPGAGELADVADDGAALANERAGLGRRAEEPEERLRRRGSEGALHSIARCVRFLCESVLALFIVYPHAPGHLCVSGSV